MYVKDMPETARARLVTIADDATLIEAAGLLTSGTDVVVVLNGDGTLEGVVTKTDVVKQISTCQGAACHVTISSVMTRDVVLCQGSDPLQDVAERMKARHLKYIPVVDEDNRPSGLLTARAVLRVLLGDAEHEEARLVDYVKGVGYR
jgi:CBS domain-containing protein